jgi:uncharacterized protein (DUF697 family)/predicted GTPase
MAGKVGPSKKWQTQYNDARARFEQKLEEIKRDTKRPVILLCGYTGSGKTSLIHSVCGPDVVPCDKIGHGAPTTQNYEYFESDQIRFWDAKGFEPEDKEEEFVKGTKDFVRKLQNTPEIDDHIHLVWYCLQPPRVTKYDLDLIRNVFTNVIIVLTKKDITKPQQHEAMMKLLLDAGVEKDRIIAVSADTKDGLESLVKVSYQLLPSAYRDAFMAAQIVRIEEKDKKAAGIIAANAAAAAAVGAIPIPVADAPILMGIQAEMIAALAANYGVASEGLNMVFMPLLASALGLFAASNLLILVPIAGEVIKAAVASSITSAIGMIVSAYFRSVLKAHIDGLPIPQFKFDESAFKEAYAKVKK